MARHQRRHVRPGAPPRLRPLLPRRVAQPLPSHQARDRPRRRRARPDGAARGESRARLPRDAGGHVVQRGRADRRRRRSRRRFSSLRQLGVLDGAAAADRQRRPQG
ncbi:Copper transporter [Musa troglodytarum]|uniref:Copper transporter n=1 Tax=Musa troglodytarum TaxID=320322 RepID=A0A9E7JME7_9LILI|nr:Copper transporter [Musa troglodytarum]